MSSATAPVDPRDYKHIVILWDTFNGFAAGSNAILFVLTLLCQHGEGTHAILLNLLGIFVLVSVSACVLPLSGHAFDMYPPFHLCLYSSVASMWNVPLMAGSALAMVVKVWSGVVIACHPTWRREFLEWVNYTPLLLALPYIAAVPIFVTGLSIALQNPSLVFRGSPFYCIVENSALQNAASGLAAGFTLLCLVFSAWITGTLLHSRWRLRQIIDYHGVPYSFVLRTLLFSCFVAVALVVSIVSLTSSFSAVVPDVVVSTCNVALFFIFSTSRTIIDFVFPCRREKPISMPSGIIWHTSGVDSQVSRVDRDAPREMLSFTVVHDASERSSQLESKSKTTRVGTGDDGTGDDGSLWGFKSSAPDRDAP
uniref:G-protein coupled receptors family 2 profile 2 domain-containing protein n=1 Tax=Mycena chlorophos TaxID=658473 RepID=A0ABQ0LY26_MYCCL|nr:predicted protein [Mycena chlorophos]